MKKTIKMNTNRIAFVLWLLSSLFIAQTALSQTIQLKDRREIFVDSLLIEKLDEVALVMHHPQDKGAVLQFDKPWEGAFSLFGTVIKDGDLYRMYYRGLPGTKAAEVTCYAESKDGIHWVKPDLNLFQMAGYKNNNVVLSNFLTVTHNFSPFLDKNPKVLPKQRYKAIGGKNRKTGLYALVSEDGIHWTELQDTPIITDGVFDSQNVVFWSESEEQYVCYFRTWTGGDYKGFRTVSRTTSKDFIHWKKPESMKFDNGVVEQFYTQQTSPYFRAPHIYLAIGVRFMPKRQVVSDEEANTLGVDPKYYKDCSDAFIMSTRGGNMYNRTFMESFIRPGIGLSNWVSRTNFPVLNVVQTGPEEMSIYVNVDYAQKSAHIKRYAMRLDGFASLQAPYVGGEVLTKPFTFEGKELELNYSTSAAGNIQVEIQDIKGNPIQGFSLEDCPMIIGNEIGRIVKWKQGSDVSKLANVPVRLRIVMKDADLYAIKFNK